MAVSAPSTGPFGRYLIRERLARGGMGEVFEAVALGADGFEKRVVVKRLLPKFAQRKDVADLFAREAKLMTRLVHPNIVQVIDFGRGEHDDYFLVMELVSGVDLGRLCAAFARRQERVPASLALLIAAQALRGLAHAHGTFSADSSRLVHRDISPGNVLLSRFGEVKIADFGVALVASAAAPVGHGEPIVGKPGYIAPEQLAGGGVDERADIYSLGITLFETITGHLPVLASAPDGSDRGAEQPPFEELAALVSPELAKVIARALATNPAQRFPDARSMALALAELALPVATADELAEAVTKAMEESVATRRAVVVLSPAEEGASIVGTELTRRGVVDDERTFTLDHAGEEPPAGTVAAANAKAPKVSRVTRGRLVAFAVFAVLGVALWSIAHSARRSEISRTVVPSPAPSLGGSIVVLPPLPPAALSLSGEPVPASSRSAGSRRVSAPEAAPSLAADSINEDCHGQLHLYADHGWVLSGGPAVVQAPGRYDWPCGRFSLLAISRVDARQSKRLSVSVRPGAPSVIDLR